MDLVKLSAAGGAAVMATLVLVSTSGQGRAEPVGVELLPETSPTAIRSRIDAAFRAAEPTPTFALTGPLFPATQAPVPTLPVTPLRPRWPMADASVETWSPLIEEAATRFGVPAEWVRGVMQQESGGRTMLGGRPITSHAGAMGLMQVMPATFAELSARYSLGSDPYDPRANILAGAAYLREMYDRFGPVYFLAAYNAGPARVEAHLRRGTPLPGETRAYTAALLPRLLPRAAQSTVTSFNGVQDLTSAAALRALSSPSSRSADSRRADPASASVFVTASASPATAGQQATRPVGDSLFVTLSASDRRRETSAATAVED